MDIAGEKGKIIVNGTSITLYKYNMPVSKFTYKAKNMWESLEVKEEKIELDTNVPVGHGEIIKNFARTILKKENLISPGEEGIKSVEFINACILSGKTGKPVKIPLNRKEYDNLMKQLIAKSKVKKAVKVQRVTDPKFAK
ncbi:MAG: Gfo/Idh/MocA family oxidoreductase, partial [Candidatus Omnitrophica bacterium]|nr:Gfo/Idh/MocA family oxidoreductase [Candidatus Omnitrophota bacterium]